MGKATAVYSIPGGIGRQMTKVQIYTDGSARGNPDGPGGYGTVLHFTDSSGQLHEKTMSGGYAII